MKFKDFKKISSGKDKTIFKHKNGSFLHVAHKGLDPKHKKQLDALPCFAEGGGVSKEEDTASEIYSPQDPTVSADQTPVVQQDPENRAEMAALREQQISDSAHKLFGKGAEQTLQNINQYPVPSQQQDVAPAVTPDGDMASPDRAPAATPEEPESQQEMPPSSAIQSGSSINPADTQAAEKDKAAAADYQKGFQDYHRENAQKLGMEDAAWQHDLQNGHVTPETYHDLFAKRDTLGKIGMLFGLLVSGAGAGLSHQSSSVMDAMNKEIENDFNAQKQSKDYAQNFVKLHQQQALNESQIKYQGKQGEMVDAQAAGERAQAEMLGQASALMKANRVALHDQVLKVQAMPPGPMKSQAEAALALMGSAVDGKNANIADVMASKAAMAKMITGGGQANTTLMKAVPGMEGVANDMEQKAIPGVGQAQVPVPQGKRDELEAMNVLDYKAKDLLDFARKNKGSLDPKIRAVGAQKAEEMMNYYNNSIKGGVMTEGRLKWLDQQIKKNPTTIFQDVLGNNARMTEIMQSNAQRKNLMLQNLGAPTQPEDKSYPVESEMVPVIHPNGQRGMIPKNNLQKAIKQGYKAAQ